MVGHALLQPLMSKCVQERVEQAMLVVCYLPARMHAVYTEIPTDRLSWSEPQPVPTDDRGVCLDNPYG